MSDPLDPKGLISEAYRIEGIGAPECRSIFLDWALSLPAGTDEPAAVATLLARHGDAEPAHPMTETLRAALAPGPKATRRGGAAGRRTT